MVIPQGTPSGDANSVAPDDVSRANYLFLETDEGVTGIASASSPDIKKLFPVLEGKDPRGVIGLWKEMSDVGFKGGVEGSMYGAMCALDGAMWDIKAKDAGEPLWRFLGAHEPRVKAYASGLDTGMTPSWPRSTKSMPIWVSMAGSSRSGWTSIRTCDASR